MAFKPGHQKRGGRTKGTPNKSTQALSELLEELNHDPLKETINTLPLLNPSDRVKTNLKLLEFIYPRKKAMEIEADVTSHEVKRETIEEWAKKKREGT